MKNQSLLLVLLLMAFISCNSKKDNSELLDVYKDQELLDEYFMAATVGVISATDDLKYVLKTPLTNEVSDDVLQKIISLDPHVDGKITLSNNTILTFTPNNPLLPNQTYTVNLDMKKLNSQIFTKNISYKLKTFKQDMTVEREGLIIKDDGSVSIILIVKTADKVSLDQLKKCFKSDANEIEIIERNPNEYEVECRYESGMKKQSGISYDGNPIGCDVKGTIELFDLNTKEFGIVFTHHNVGNKEFNIYFSQRLNKNMDLTGLLKVQNEAASYTIKDNVLTIFLGEIHHLDKATISLEKNITSIENKTLPTSYSFNIELQMDHPEALFVSDGNYFPSEGDFKIPIKTRALDALRIVVIEIKQENVLHYLAWQSISQADYYNLRMYGKPVYDQVVSLNKGIRDNEGWTVHGIDLSEKISKNPGSIYHISLEFAPENTSLSCKSDLKKYQFNSKIPDSDFFTIRDNYYNDYYYYYEDYNWEESNNPCKLPYYVQREPTQKLFICSDYSIIAKKAGNNYHLAINKLMDLSPVTDATVTLFDLQAEKIGFTKTSSLGFAEFSQASHEAVVLKIEKNNHITYLSLDPNQSNSLTEFDIAGERSETDTEFFVYTDRDVWRPGDSIYVDMMINKLHSDLPAGLPVVLTFFNTENMVIDEQLQQIDLDKKQIYHFALYTNTNAKTGIYRCMLQVGAKSIRKNIRVETIKPNTAETIYTFDHLVDNTIYDDKISGSIVSKYLTGFEIADAKIKATAKGRKLTNPFPKFTEYYFDVYDNTSFDDNFELYDIKTNQNGSGSFSSNSSLKTFNAPVNISIETETILPGGGTNKEGKTVMVSPFRTYIGASRKEGSGWNGNHTFKEDVIVSLINLTDKGTVSTQNNKISYSLQQHINSWWIDKYRLRSAGNFVNADYWKNIDNGSVNITGKGKIIIPKGKYGKGAYKLTMTDEASGHATQVYFTIYDGIESIPGDQPYIVEFKTDKDNYTTGEVVIIVLPDIDDAKALISIERGNRVIEQIWYDLKKENNIVVLQSSERWSPNVYIHVTIMQKYKQDNNDLPLRMYGIKHIKMDGTMSALKPVTNIPDKLESNKEYTFTVAENEGRPMDYTLALVDEGLLNLTGFATPDPVKHFNGKYPLLVKTWDIYQYLIQYFKGTFAGIISIGGDDAYNPDAIAEVNRFKPIAIHKGSFKLVKGGKNSHTIYIPNYIGKVRLMIIACNDGNFGKTDKFIPVKNPLMIQSQFPRTLNVTDKLQLPVTILRDDQGISTANLTVKTNTSLIKGFTPSTNVSFNGKNTILQNYNVEVLNQTGALNVEMTISGNGKKMTETTDILINFPNSYESSITKTIVEKGDKVSITVKPKGYKDVFTSKIMISGLKVPNFTQYAEELIDYPYGCLEQTTSSGFGQLYLDKVLQLDPKANRERLENLQTTINKLSRFQQSSGKFNYWDGNYYHAWSGIYAGNFLVEMQKLGYLPGRSDLLSKWISGQTLMANNWALAEATNDYIYESESLAQAFRLFVLAKGSKPAKSAMNRFVTSNKSKNPVTWWLIAGSFQLSGYDSKAKEYLNYAEGLQKNYTERSYNSFGDRGRDWAIIVEVLSYIGDKTRLETYYDQMVETLNGMSWTSTQTKGFAFIAAYKYFGKALGLSNQVEYAISGLNGGNKSYQHSSYEPMLIKMDKSSFNKPLTVQNKGKGKLYIYQSDRYIDNQLKKEGSSNNLSVKMDYYNLTRKQNNIDNLHIGDDIIISAKVTNPSALEQNDLALNVKMPAGWELINPRLYETDIQKDNVSYIYQDYKDDRVYTFFGLNAGESRTYSFRAKAAFTGDFYMPAVSCEHMYKGNINAKTPTGRVMIDK